MGVIIRVKRPDDENVNKIVIQSGSTYTASSSFVAIAGSPFTIRKGPVRVLEYEDTSGTLTRWYRSAFIDESDVTGSYTEPFQPIGKPYSSTQDFWNWLNFYTRVRNETVTTSGDGSTTVYELSQSNIIDGTLELRYGATSASYTELLPTTDFAIDLNDGTVYLENAGITKISSSGCWANYNYADIPDSVIKDFIRKADKEIERDLNRKFGRYSETEYISVEEAETDFVLKHFPVITLSTIEENTAGKGNTATWITRSFGYSSDYWTNTDDLNNGMVHFMGNNDPSSGFQNLKITYDWGFDQIPRDVQQLSTMITIRNSIINPVFAQSLIKGQDTFTGFNLNTLNTEIERHKSKLVKWKIVKI